MFKHCGDVLVQFICRIMQTNRNLTPKLTKCNFNNIFHRNCLLLLCTIFLSMQDHHTTNNSVDFLNDPTFEWLRLVKNG